MDNQEQNNNSRKVVGKVFGNSYNTGEMNSFSTDEIVLNESYRKRYLREEYETDSYHRMRDLSQELYDYLKESEYKNYLSDDHKIIKNELPFLLDKILIFMDGKQGFTFAEKFMVVCEVLDVRDSLIYECLPVRYKDIALNELGKENKDIEKKQENRKIS